MINSDNKYYKFKRGSLNRDNGEDSYNGRPDGSILGEHIPLIKLFAEKLKFGNNEFFTISLDSSHTFNYYFKILEDRFINIKLRRGEYNTTVVFECINYERDIEDIKDSIELGLDSSMVSEETILKFNIILNFIETGSLDENTPIKRFTFGNGKRKRFSSQA